MKAAEYCEKSKVGKAAACAKAHDNPELFTALVCTCAYGMHMLSLTVAALCLEKKIHKIITN